MNGLQPAYIAILVATLLPYVWTTIAKAGGSRYDNSDPRGWLQREGNARAHRANGAQLNAFESLPGFIAAVLMAQLAGVAHPTINLLACAFIALRVLHGLFYIGNKPPLRSLSWLGGLACVLGLMGLAIAHIG